MNEVEKIFSLIYYAFKNSRITIVYTCNEDKGKLQILKINKFEQDEVLEIIEEELWDKCKKKQNDLVTDFSSEAKGLCRYQI